MTKEEAINQLGWLKCKTNKERHLEAIDMAIEALKNERPKGHWITKWSGNGWDEDWDYTCSVCEKEYKKASSILYHASYCPNCGADMRPKLVGKHADVTIIDEACMKGADDE